MERETEKDVDCCDCCDSTTLRVEVDHEPPNGCRECHATGKTDCLQCRGTGRRTDRTRQIDQPSWERGWKDSQRTLPSEQTVDGAWNHGACIGVCMGVVMTYVIVLLVDILTAR